MWQQPNRKVVENMQGHHLFFCWDSLIHHFGGLFSPPIYTLYIISTLSYKDKLMRVQIAKLLLVLSCLFLLADSRVKVFFVFVLFFKIWVYDKITIITMMTNRKGGGVSYSYGLIFFGLFVVISIYFYMFSVVVGNLLFCFYFICVIGKNL